LISDIKSGRIKKQIKKEDNSKVSSQKQLKNVDDIFNLSNNNTYNSTKSHTIDKNVVNINEYSLFGNNEIVNNTNNNNLLEEKTNNYSKDIYDPFLFDFNKINSDNK
jgi:hypothetical protein